MVETLVLPEMSSLGTQCWNEIRSVLRSWRHDPRTRSFAFDGQRFLRLQEVIEQRLKRVLAGRSRRMLFNMVRSLRIEEVRHLAGCEDLDSLLFGQILIEATRAVCRHGKPAGRERDPGSPIRLTVREREQIDVLASAVARTVALAALLVQADVGYRWAGKGMRLRLDETGAPLSPTSAQGWLWRPDAMLEAAMAEYDTRRQRYWTIATGMPAPEDKTFGPDAVPWLTAGTCALPMRVHCPRLNLELVTEGFGVGMSEIGRRLRMLEVMNAAFQDRFGLDAVAFGRVCRAVSGSLLDLAGISQFRAWEEVDGALTLTCDTDRQTALDHLHEILSEGVVRAPTGVWVETLSQSRYGFEPATTQDVSAFVTAFTSRPGAARRDLSPWIFLDIERDMLVLDLTAAGEFIDLCYRSLVVGQGGRIGKERGRQFEDIARRGLETGLGLQPPYPVPPGFKLAKAGLADNEVDFCFLWHNVLVHIDFKSLSRGTELFRGDFRATRNRVSRLEDYLLHQVEPRGRALVGLLRDQGKRVDTVVDLLCTADVEYVPPGQRMRYAGVPRVLAVDEITDLLHDGERWPAVVSAARRSGGFRAWCPV